MPLPPQVSSLAQTPYTTQPYWDIENQPHFYQRTGTIYHRIKWAEALSIRGIRNALLGNLAKYLPSGAYLAGGFVATALRCDKNLQPSDIDIFFSSPEAFDQTYELFKSGGPTDGWAFKNYEHRDQLTESSPEPKRSKLVKFTSSLPDKLPIQLIKMIWYNDCEHVIDSFDFTATQFAIDGEYLVYNPLAPLDLAKKSLVTHRHHYPADTLYRMVKYINKGYAISPASLLTIAEAIKHSEVDDPPMLNRFYDDKV